MRIGRNELCHCGSGKKYKRCCLGKKRLPDLPSTLSSVAPPKEFARYIQEKYKYIINFNQELRDVADIAINREYKNQNDKQFFTSFCLGKAYKTHLSILTLCKQGYGEDAAILARSLYELMINLIYILNDSSGERLKRYASYDWIIRQQIYEYAKTVPEMVKMIEERGIDPRPGDETPKDIAEQAKECKEKYNFRSYGGWSDKSIAKMAEEVGRVGAYRTVYSLFSNFTHTAPRAMNDYIKENKDGFTVEVGPTENFVEETLVASFDFFITIIDRFDELNGEMLKDKTADVEKRYLQKVEEINNQAT